MPYVSQRQRRFMKARHPEIAERWREESGPQRDLPERAAKRKKKGKRPPRTARNDKRQRLVEQFLNRARNG